MPPSAVAIVMTTLLPSQRVDHVYVGPEGMLVRQAQPTAVPEEDAEAEEETEAVPKKRWQDLKQKVSTVDSVIDSMRSSVRQASHGVSSTRNTSKFASELADALATARLDDRPSLVDVVDFQMQIEILAALPISSTSAASRVCKIWRELFDDVDSGLWQQLVASASCRAVSAAHAKVGLIPSAHANAVGLAPAGGSCRALGRKMQADAAALKARWLSGTCGESVLRSVHSDYVMSMVLHDGRLISSSADRSIAITDMSQHLHRTHVGKELGEAHADNDDGGVDGQKRTRAAHYVPPRMLYGHRGQVLCVHAFGEHLASSSSDGDVLIWTLPDGGTGAGGGVHRRHRFGRVYALAMEARGVVCGLEGSSPICMYDWRDGSLLAEMGDEEPPKGVTTCVLRPKGTPLLAAGNSDNHSQLRVWDVRTSSLLERFTLPAYTKGVRCLASPSDATLVGGTTNGWVLLFDLRTGRYERRFAHADCCNALAVSGHYLVSGGDDKIVRITDLRKHSFSSLGSHRVRSVVYAACCDEEAIFVGCDAGDVRIFDYSAEANPQTGAEAGGFTAQQKAALSQAIASAQHSPNRPAHRTPGRIRPAH